VLEFEHSAVMHIYTHNPIPTSPLRMSPSISPLLRSTVARRVVLCAMPWLLAALAHRRSVRRPRRSAKLGGLSDSIRCEHRRWMAEPNRTPLVCSCCAALRPHAIHSHGPR
jgi:hypothetical protein